MTHQRPNYCDVRSLLRKPHLQNCSSEGVAYIYLLCARPKTGALAKRITAAHLRFEYDITIMDNDNELNRPSALLLRGIFLDQKQVFH